MSDMTRKYFEGDEYKRKKLARWEQINLKLVMEENNSKGKSTQDCLNLLLAELRQLQLSMDSDLRTYSYLHVKIINACRNISACS